MATLDWDSVSGEDMMICYETDQRIMKRGKRYVLLPDNVWSDSKSKLMGYANNHRKPAVAEVPIRELTDAELDEYERLVSAIPPGESAPKDAQDYFTNWK